ncbi:retrovirus-related pol polyprotein from transposon TNT 1-94 [Tanacetum coccineum]
METIMIRDGHNLSQVAQVGSYVQQKLGLRQLINVGKVVENWVKAQTMCEYETSFAVNSEYSAHMRELGSDIRVWSCRLLLTEMEDGTRIDCGCLDMLFKNDFVVLASLQHIHDEDDRELYRNSFHKLQREQMHSESLGSQPYFLGIKPPHAMMISLLSVEKDHCLAFNSLRMSLPTEIYALMSQHRVAKDLWEKIKLLMQGTSLTKQERECKLYDEFDKFIYKKGETLHEYYLRFTLLLNDIEQFTRLPFGAVVPPYQTQQFTTNQSTPLSITYPSNEYQSSVHHNVYSSQPSISQVEYAPTAYQQQQPEFSQPDFGLVVPVFQKGMIHFDASIHDGRQTTYAAGTMRKYTPGTSGSNMGKQRTVICYNCKGEGHMAKQCTKPKRKRDETWFNDKVLLVQGSSKWQALTEEEITFLADLGLPDIQTSQTVITHNAAY